MNGCDSILTYSKPRVRVHGLHYLHALSGKNLCEAEEKLLSMSLKLR